MIMIRKSRFLAKYGIIPMLVLCAFMFISRDSVKAETFSWSGVEIIGDDSGYMPAGEATFVLDGAELTLTITNTGDELINNSNVLTGLFWDIEGAGTIISADSATADDVILPTGTNSEFDVTGDNVAAYWGYNDTDLGGDVLGSFGVGTMGDLLGIDEAGFGTLDIIDGSVELTTVLPNPNDVFESHIDGVDFGIISDATNKDNGFENPLFPNSPFVRNELVFLFTVTSDFETAWITNVRPVFGSLGQTTVPEPATVLLLGSGLVGLALYGRRRFGKKANT